MVLYHTVLDCVSSSVIRFSDSLLSLSEIVWMANTHNLHLMNKITQTTYVCMHMI